MQTNFANRKKLPKEQTNKTIKKTQSILPEEQD